ncbi:hypothetical protein U1Q18_027676, partial [Sarracenia purpurea var. burkii]
PRGEARLVVAMGSSRAATRRRATLGAMGATLCVMGVTLCVRATCSLRITRNERCAEVTWCAMAEARRSVVCRIKATPKEDSLVPVRAR